jgi:hypothetical protein
VVFKEKFIFLKHERNEICVFKQKSHEKRPFGGTGVKGSIILKIILWRGVWTLFNQSE